jgi:hypothetical protein
MRKPRVAREYSVYWNPCLSSCKRLKSLYPNVANILLTLFMQHWGLFNYPVGRIKGQLVDFQPDLISGFDIQDQVGAQRRHDADALRALVVQQDISRYGGRLYADIAGVRIDSQEHSQLDDIFGLADGGDVLSEAAFFQPVQVSRAEHDRVGENPVCLDVIGYF